MAPNLHLNTAQDEGCRNTKSGCEVFLTAL